VRRYLHGQSDTSTNYIVLIAGDTIYGTVNYLNERGTNPKFYKYVLQTTTENVKNIKQNYFNWSNTNSYESL
jgi:hypothetical protein